MILRFSFTEEEEVSESKYNYSTFSHLLFRGSSTVPSFIRDRDRWSICSLTNPIYRNTNTQSVSSVLNRSSLVVTWFVLCTDIEKKKRHYTKIQGDWAEENQSEDRGNRSISGKHFQRSLNSSSSSPPHLHHITSSHPLQRFIGVLLLLTQQHILRHVLHIEEPHTCDKHNVIVTL